MEYFTMQKALISLGIEEKAQGKLSLISICMLFQGKQAIQAFYNMNQESFFIDQAVAQFLL